VLRIARMEVGAIVRCREQDWVVMPNWLFEQELMPEVSPEEVLVLRPLIGPSEEYVVVYRELVNLGGYEIPEERVVASQFPLPVAEGVKDAVAAHLLWQAARLSLREGAAPLRCIGRLSIRPRAYQLVPLLMALRMDPVRLFIADDVGVGKTIEALLIVRELYERGVIQRFAVLCPPYLCDQWAKELEEKFGFEAVVVRSGTARSLERAVPAGDPIYKHFPFLVMSIDWVKSDRHRDLFMYYCPELVIVDEAHGAAAADEQAQQERHRLLRAIAKRADRHLILLTATPHSGVEGAFRSLIVLIQPEFDEWDLANLSPPQIQRLAGHFVQRTRRDIERDWEAQHCFPERLSEDRTYHLSSAYETLFQKAYHFCQGVIRTGRDLAEHKQRVRYWGALALLRSVMSSPAAAKEALEARMHRQTVSMNEALEREEAEIDFSRYVVEPVTETAQDENPVFPIEQAFGREAKPAPLYEVWEIAKAIYNTPNDTKTQRCAEVVQELLLEGYHPIVWCRYVATAVYVGEWLRAQAAGVWGLPETQVVVITGRIAEDERRIKIDAIDPTLPRILVATDCLSEGVNLQEKFSAVIHYDLPWNPNRLEQREGRVDRYGQSASCVRVIHFYGRNNPIDGVILEVLLRKARDIHQTLGTSVPIPAASESLSEVLLEALFFRGQYQSGGQLSLFGSEAVVAFHKRWEKDLERERIHRTRFAQAALRPHEVLQALEATDRVLGDPEAVRTFVLTATERYGLLVRPETQALYRLFLPSEVIEKLPEALVRALPAPAGRAGGEWLISFTSPTPAGAIYLGRNHPFVAALAQHLLEEVFVEPSKSRAARSGVIRTRAVSHMVVLLLLRVRYLIREDREGLAEEVLVVGYQAPPVSKGSPARWLSEAEALMLLASAKPDANITLTEKRELLQEALSDLEPWYPQAHVKNWGIAHPLQKGIREWVEERAAALEESYKRLRKAMTLKGKAPTLKPYLPPDLLGLLVLQPALP